MQAFPQVNIDTTLAHLRWRAADFEPQTLLRYVAQYRDYYVVTQRGRLAPAPDDKNRFLIAVFTSVDSCNEFLIDGGIEADAVDIEKIEGRTLFPKIATANPEGVVFNCRGPQDSIAFVPRMIVRVLEHMDDPQRDAPPTSAMQIDFDTMAANAFPRSRLGARPDLDLLWAPAFSLDAWHALVHPRDAAQPTPYVRLERGVVTAYLFTDETRPARSIALPELRADDGSYLLMPISPLSLVESSRLDPREQPFDTLRFNFGNPGWYSPLRNMAHVFDHLNAQKS